MNTYPCDALQEGSALTVPQMEGKTFSPISKSYKLRLLPHLNQLNFTENWPKLKISKTMNQNIHFVQIAKCISGSQYAQVQDRGDREGEEGDGGGGGGEE